jgi:hypothetical protein
MKRWEGFNVAIIGTASIWNGNERVEVLVYSHDLMVHQLMVRDGMTEVDAFEYIDFNIDNAYIGKDTPIIVWEYNDD